MDHFEQLCVVIPDLATKKILDIGCGGGSFLVSAAAHGATVTGIELKPEKVLLAAKRISEFPNARVVEGVGERLPFPDQSFDFANLCELIEHVQDPVSLLSEVSRILVPGGLAYLSVPNRFGLIDQHFNLPLLSWMPRRWGELYVHLSGKGKRYHGESGLQRISEMHYYTLKQIKALVSQQGFAVSDIRLQKLQRKPRLQQWFLIPVYHILKHVYFDSFHLLLHNRI